MIGQPRPVKTFNDVNQDTGNEYELQPFLARMPSINKRLKEISAYNYYKRQNTEYNKHSKEILQSNGLTRTE